jgi:hypothetical protein
MTALTTHVIPAKAGTSFYISVCLKKLAACAAMTALTTHVIPAKAGTSFYVTIARFVEPYFVSF